MIILLDLDNQLLQRSELLAALLCGKGLQHGASKRNSVEKGASGGWAKVRAINKEIKGHNSDFQLVDNLRAKLEMIDVFWEKGELVSLENIGSELFALIPENVTRLQFGETSIFRADVDDVLAEGNETWDMKRLCEYGEGKALNIGENAGIFKMGWWLRDE